MGSSELWAGRAVWLRHVSFLEYMGWLGLREVMGYPCALLLQRSLRQGIRLLPAYVDTT